mmetsp:Transcript_70012/g.121157  ORF Transcript_70012/g.121157 Transcript_70012/m.121157 type:complete len:322 (+) Transcript_70012:2-967(+)
MICFCRPCTLGLRRFATAPRAPETSLGHAAQEQAETAVVERRAEAQEEDVDLEVCIRSLSGELIVSLHMPSRSSIQSVKKYLSQQSGYKLYTQQLLCRHAGILDKSQTLRMLTPPVELQLVCLPFDADAGNELLQSALQGDAQAVVRHLEAPACPDWSRPRDGLTPLIAASHIGAVSCVESLLEAGADRDKAETTSCASPIFVASQEGHPEIVQILCNARADVNQPARGCVTPLYMAAQNGYIRVVEMLCKAQANLNVTQKEGATPLCMAAEKGHLQVIRHLVAMRADVRKPRKDGKSPLTVAAFFGHSAVAEFLDAFDPD